MKRKTRSKSIVKPGNTRPISTSVAQAITDYLQRDQRPYRVVLALNDGEYAMAKRAAEIQGLPISTIVRACSMYGMALFLEATRKDEE